MITNKRIKQIIKEQERINNLIDITFFIPCLNEEASIIATLDKCISISAVLNLAYELVIINDASTDNTRNLIENYAKEHAELPIRIVNNEIRRGLGYNYVTGAFVGLGKYYMMICGDNSETEESIRQIIEKRGSADIVVPYFGHLDKRNIIRTSLSKLFTKIVNLVSGHKLRYYNGVVLHLRKNVMRWHPMATGFGYQAELLCLLLDEHKSYIEVNISNIDRKDAFSRAFHLKNFLSVAHSLHQIVLRRVRRTIWQI